MPWSVLCRQCSFQFKDERKSGFGKPAKKKWHYYFPQKCSCLIRRKNQVSNNAFQIITHVFPMQKQRICKKKISPHSAPTCPGGSPGGGGLRDPLFLRSILGSKKLRLFVPNKKNRQIVQNPASGGDPQGPWGYRVCKNHGRQKYR